MIIDPNQLGPTPEDRRYKPEWMDSEVGEGGSLYLPIPLVGIRMDTVASFDLYVKTQPHRFVKYRDQQEVITPAVFARLREFNTNYLYIPISNRGEYSRYIEQQLPTIIADPSIPIEQKATLVYNTTSNIIQDLMQSPSAANLTRTDELAGTLIDVVKRGGEALSALLRLASYDYYTYTHSVNVSVYAVALSSRLGIDSQASIHRLALGAIMHDIGKSFLSNEILMQPRSLTRDEFTTVKEHPGLGAGVISQEAKKMEEVALIVHQHHEALDGSGYPDGLKENQIHPYAKIITILDMYDALTTRRVYRSAYSPIQALKIIAEHVGRSIDDRIFAEFVKLLGTIGPG